MELMKFPFPNSKLSPNNRSGHLYNTGARSAARETGFWTIKECGLQVEAAPLEMYMLICPPDKRRRDNDNVVGAFKSYRDGMFQALGVDDSHVHRLIVERGGIVKDGAVYVGLSNLKKGGTMHVLTAKGAQAIKHPEFEGFELRDLEVVNKAADLIRAELVAYYPMTVHLSTGDFKVVEE